MPGPLRTSVLEGASLIDATDDPTSPFTNLRVFMDYLVGSDSLSSLNQPGPVANYDPGGEETGVMERWENKTLEVKKFIDDVSGNENLHATAEYASKILNDVSEIRYIHAPLAQDLFDRVRVEAASKGMKLNEKKTNIKVPPVHMNHDLS